LSAGIVMILISLVWFFARKSIGRFQANVLLGVFRIGEDRQPEIAAGIANAWITFSALFFLGGIVIVVASLV